MLPTRILLLSTCCLTIESFTPALRHSARVSLSKLARSPPLPPADAGTILRLTRRSSTASKDHHLFLLTASSLSSSTSTSSSALPDNTEKDSFHDNNAVVIRELSSHPSPRCNHDDNAFPFEPKKIVYVKKTKSSSPKSSPLLHLFLLVAILTNSPTTTLFNPSAANAIQPKNEALCNTGFFTNVGAWYCTDIGNIGDEGRSKPLSGGEEERLDGLLGKFNFGSGSDDADDNDYVGVDGIGGVGGGNDGDGGGNGNDGVK